MWRDLAEFIIFTDRLFYLERFQKKKIILPYREKKQKNIFGFPKNISANSS